MENYPKPSVPINPTLSGAISFKDHKVQPSILNSKSVRYVTSGRIAIALALQHANIKEGDKVLIPAFHCSSMVEPIIWANATPVFFRLNDDVSIDLDDIDQKMDSSVRLLMVTHYFGFPQDMPTIRKFCDDRKILLLEDCAHAFFGETHGKAIGTYGDYAIGSIMKFFPVFDGGCLVSQNNNINTINLVSAGLPFQFKSALNILEYAFEYKRLFLLHFLIGWLFAAKDYIWKKLKASGNTGSRHSLAPGAAEGGYEFEHKWLNIRMSIPSRICMRLTSSSRLVTKRRQNYKKIISAVKDIPGVTPLFKNFPDTIVPYVCPVIFDNAKEIFPVLKRRGVPIVRFGEFLWDGVDASTCKVSEKLSRSLFQFPCHQSLKEEEIDWIISEIKKATETNKAGP